MSANYYRVRPDVFQSKFYGFKKVTKAELDDIVIRMQKKTFCKELYDGDINQSRPSPPRPPSSKCRKAPDDHGTFGGTGHRQRVDDRTLYRIIRRLKKPTISRLVATGRYNHETPAVEQSVFVRPLSQLPAEEQQERLKARMRIFRHTTSSRGKRAVECPFCDDPTMHRSLVFDLDYGEDRSASTEELESILRRLTCSTHASGGGVTPCNRQELTCSAHCSAANLPLISGLKRSKNVDEIVTRLFTPTRCRPISRPSTAPARPISAPAKLVNKSRRPKIP